MGHGKRSPAHVWGEGKGRKPGTEQRGRGWTWPLPGAAGLAGRADPVDGKGIRICLASVNI